MHLIHLSHAPNATDGGIASAVAELVAAQQKTGMHATWLTADRYPALQRDRHLQIALGSMQPSLAHLHGLWRSPTRIAPPLARGGLPLVVAPHGMLNPMALAHSRWKKRLVWHLWEERALRSAHCLHALCPAEATSIRALLPDKPIAVIPNGVAMPLLAKAEDTETPQAALPWQGVIPSDQQILLFLGRFHSGKGITPLLQAWEAVATEAERQGWWLVLVGYGDGGALERQLQTSPVPRCMAFGPVFGRAKQAVLASAGAFVLPSHFEALPMAALEAMTYGLPCLLSSACNLPQAFTKSAALRAEPNPEPLALALKQLIGLSQSARIAMGQSGRALVAQNYSWPTIAAQTDELYDWILKGGAFPSFVF